MAQYVISVMSRDRSGIIAGIAGAVFQIEGNVDELSQTVMGGHFTVILSATFPDAVDADALRDAVAASAEPGELAVSVRDMADEPAAAPCKPPTQGVFILSVMGKDQPGTICQFSSYLAKKGINILDCYAKATADRFDMILEVQIPDGVDVPAMQSEIDWMGVEMGFSARLQHENIFIATNEPRPVRIGPSASG